MIAWLTDTFKSYTLILCRKSLSIKKGALPSELEIIVDLQLLLLFIYLFNTRQFYRKRHFLSQGSYSVPKTYGNRSWQLSLEVRDHFHCFSLLFNLRRHTELSVYLLDCVLFNCFSSCLPGSMKWVERISFSHIDNCVDTLPLIAAGLATSV